MLPGHSSWMLSVRCCRKDATGGVAELAVNTVGCWMALESVAVELGVSCVVLVEPTNDIIGCSIAVVALAVDGLTCLIDGLVISVDDDSVLLFGWVAILL